MEKQPIEGSEDIRTTLERLKKIVALAKQLRERASSAAPSSESTTK